MTDNNKTNRGGSDEFVKKKVVIQNELGIHVRPASMLASTAGRFKAMIMIRKDSQVVDGKSIMQILMLGALQGTELTIEAQGADADAAVAALVEVVQNNFGE